MSGSAEAIGIGDGPLGVEKADRICNYIDKLEAANKKLSEDNQALRDELYLLRLIDQFRRTGKVE